MCVFHLGAFSKNGISLIEKQDRVGGLSFLKNPVQILFCLSDVLADDLGKGYLVQVKLQVMRQNQYTHLRSWISSVMAPVLQEAIRSNLEQDFARELFHKKYKQAIIPSGEVIPLLEFHILGDFQLKFNQRILAGSESFSPALPSSTRF